MDAIVDKKSKSKLNIGRGPSVYKPTREEAEAAARTLLAWTGDDPDREGLRDTPKRIVKAYEEFFDGYNACPMEALERTFDDVGGYDDIVLLRDIDFNSHCEHHVVPFIGKVHLAYYPSDRVVGISKLARVVEIFARRLQTQETMTAQIAQSIDQALDSRGTAVMIEAVHQCMSLRGVQKPNVATITTQFTGLFENNPHEQVRFMTLLRGNKLQSNCVQQIGENEWMMP